MKQFLPLIAVAVALSAQPPTDIFEKAPPGVEDALRARVTAFYQTWIDGKFRAGEKFVADSAQEAYYQMPKQRYESCEVIRLKWERDFKDALVTLTCKAKWNIQGQMLDTSIPHTDFWSVENDQWVLTGKSVTSIDAPLGIDSGSGLPKDANAIKRLSERIMNSVSVDVHKVELSSFEKASAIVTIKNGHNGEAQIRADADGPPPGFSLSLDRTSIPPAGEAKLTLTMDPKDKSPKSMMTVNIWVEPLSRRFPVTVTFAVPPEIQKLIEKSRAGK